MIHTKNEKRSMWVCQLVASLSPSRMHIVACLTREQGAVVSLEIPVKLGGGDERGI